MKKLVLLGILLSMTYLMQAQEFVISDIKKQEIGIGENTCHFSVLLEKPSLKLDNSTYYYWYKDGRINKNQGGYAGELLHGEYSIYSKRGDLLERGSYDNGRKEGEWKRWDSVGVLIEETHWKNGKLHGLMIEYAKGEKKERRYKQGILKKVISPKSDKKELDEKA